MKAIFKEVNYSINILRIRYFNIVLSILYALTSAFVFFILNIIACALPLTSGLLSFYLFRQAFSSPPGSLYLIVIGGAIGSLMTFANLLKSTKGAVSVPEYTNILEDSRVISLVQNVSTDVGISPFQAVYFNSELEISTFYIGRGRYINLSAIALNYLTEEEVRAVIAHECAHHHNNAMLLNRTHYRAVIFFESFANTLAVTFSTFEKLAKKNYFLSQLFGSGMLTLLPLMPCLYMYRFFLLLMATLTRDAEYEYYCDSVAAKYVGGNILASALQKLFDLNLAHYRILKRKSIRVDGNLEFRSVEQLYLEGLNREFLDIRYCNPADRTEAASRKTDTHPPMILRLKRSQAFSPKIDSSEPLWSEAEMNFWMQKLPEPSFLKTEKQKQNRSDSIRKSQESTGKAFISFNRKITFAGSFIRKYDLFIDDQCVGVIDKKNNVRCYEVEPGLHIVYIKVAKRKSEALELIVSGSDQIEILFWNLPDGNLHVALGPEQANQPQAIQNASSTSSGDIAMQQTDLRAFGSSCLPLFPVTTHKFIILSICTFGIYELYWCYQNWKRIKLASGLKLRPFWRAFFAPLWAFSLFRRIKSLAVSSGVPINWSSDTLAVFYFFFKMTQLPGPWWLISLGTLIPMIPVQQTAQRVNERFAAPNTDWKNDKYSTVNVVIIALGGFFVVMAVISSFIPE